MTLTQKNLYHGIRFYSFIMHYLEGSLEQKIYTVFTLFQPKYSYFCSMIFFKLKIKTTYNV